MRCVEKITQCPGFVKKAKKTRNANRTPEKLIAHMKKMSVEGHKTLKKLQKDVEWVDAKSKKISEAIKERGGHNGEKNPMFGKTHKNKTKIKQSIKAKNRNPKCYQKSTKTKILKGIAVPKELKTAWELYNEQINNFTLASWKKYQSIINPNNFPRGKDYELDHKFSKTEGFLQNVPPEIIGHYLNLEVIPKNKNRSKRIKCSITLEELYLEIGKCSTIPSDSPSSDTITS